MDDMEEIPGVYGDFTNNTCLEPAPGEMERGITQCPLVIPQYLRPPVFPALSRNNIISHYLRNLKAH
jgi:hypothetical protein